MERKRSFWPTSKIVTAALYVNKDQIMISQFVYCKLKNQKVTKGSPSLRNLGTAWIVGCGALRVTALCQLLLRNEEHSPASPRNNNSPDMIEMSGFICGCVSCVFYLSSRFPQLHKNTRRTEGVFFLLFALAMMGNCTGGLSLVLKMPKPKSSWTLCFVHLFMFTFVHHFSWLVGSFGVLFLDIFVSFSPYS